MANNKTVSVSAEVQYVHYEKGDLVFGGSAPGLDSERVYEVESFEPPKTVGSKGRIKLYGRYSTIEAEVYPAVEGAINNKSGSDKNLKKFYQDQIDKIKRDHEDRHDH